MLPSNFEHCLRPKGVGQTHNLLPADLLLIRGRLRNSGRKNAAGEVLRVSPEQAGFLTKG